MTDLEIIWRGLASNYSLNEGLIGSFWKEIDRAYTSNERIYHNEMHLIFMFTLAETVQLDFDNRDAVYFAIFYHDFFYDTERNDNEESSAEYAGQKMKELNVDEETIKRTIGHILATKKHEESQDSDSNYVMDLDLAILGADPDTYDDYAENIRLEYSIYPDEVFYTQRHSLLENFIKKERIFHTAIFNKLFEDKARKNIQREISAITQVKENNYE